MTFFLKTVAGLMILLRETQSRSTAKQRWSVIFAVSYPPFAVIHFNLSCSFPNSLISDLCSRGSPFLWAVTHGQPHLLTNLAKILLKAFDALYPSSFSTSVDDIIPNNNISLRRMQKVLSRHLFTFRVHNPERPCAFFQRRISGYSIIKNTDICTLSPIHPTMSAHLSHHCLKISTGYYQADLAYSTPQKFRHGEWAVVHCIFGCFLTGRENHFKRFAWNCIQITSRFPGNSVERLDTAKL